MPTKGNRNPAAEAARIRTANAVSSFGGKVVNVLADGLGFVVYWTVAIVPVWISILIGLGVLLFMIFSQFALDTLGIWVIAGILLAFSVILGVVASIPCSKKKAKVTSKRSNSQHNNRPTTPPTDNDNIRHFPYESTDRRAH